MNPFIRTAVVALVVGMLTLGVLTLRFACLPWDFQESRRNAELQRLEEATFRREEARWQAVREYIANRCTLVETMRRFQELDRQWPPYSTLVRDASSPSEEERHYQQLRIYIEVLLQERPEESAAVVRRLDKDRLHYLAGRQALSPDAP